MWTWVLSGPCHLGHMVPSRVTGVAVGGRNLNWERIPLALYHLCLSDHHPTNRTEPTHPCPSGCSFQSSWFTPVLTSIFLTGFSPCNQTWFPSLSCTGCLLKCVLEMQTHVTQSCHSSHSISVCHGHLSLKC